MPPFNLLVILGPTASGKTKLAVQLARQLNGEVISADSRQVYRCLDIGSGKDLHQYKEIPYHLIDIVDPGYEFSVFDFQREFFKAFDDITHRKKLPVLAGGSALYIDSVLNGYQMIAVAENTLLREKLEKYTNEQLKAQLLRLKPVQHNTTDLIQRGRMIRAIEIATAEADKQPKNDVLASLTPLIIGIKWPREMTRERITKRLHHRLNNGLIEEVQSLHQQGISWETLEYYGLEYRVIAQFLQQQLNQSDMFKKLNTAIHQFAKKQDTWLRRLQKQGHSIHWVDGLGNTYEQAQNLIDSV